MAAPLGNKNASKSRMFEQALIREIKQRDLKEGEGETLRRIVSAMIDLAAERDLAAVKEVRDTLDGKPKQQVELSGDEDNPVTLQMIERVIVDSK